MRGREEEGMKLDFIDVRSVLFQAATVRRVYFQLRDEAYEGWACGLLNKAMYGTRDAIATPNV